MIIDIRGLFIGELKKALLIDKSKRIDIDSIQADGKAHELHCSSDELTYILDAERNKGTIIVNRGTALEFIADSEGARLVDLKEFVEQEQREFKEKFNEIDKSKKFFVRGGDCLKQSRQTQYLIKNWLPAGKHLVEIDGKSGTGKTYLGLDFALAIATGQTNWNGNKVKKGKVCYLCAEGLDAINSRISLWCEMHGDCQINPKELDANFMRSQWATTLNNAEQLEKLIADIEAEQFHPDIVFVDTLNRHFQGDENSSIDATSFVNACDRIARHFNCCVVFIHHTGWNTEVKHGRGSSVFFASVDYCFMIEATQEKGIITLSQTKVKDGDYQRPISLKFMKHEIDSWQADDDGIQPTSSYLVQVDTPEKAKSETQIQDEQLFLNACKEYGIVQNDSVFISRENLKKYVTGKLLNSTGAPMTEKEILIQINPNQKNRFINRLIRYEYAKTISKGENDFSAIGWNLTDSNALTSCKNYLNQQASLI